MLAMDKAIKEAKLQGYHARYDNAALIFPDGKEGMFHMVADGGIVSVKRVMGSRQDRVWSPAVVQLQLVYAYAFEVHAENNEIDFAEKLDAAQKILLMDQTEWLIPYDGIVLTMDGDKRPMLQLAPATELTVLPLCARKWVYEVIDNWERQRSRSMYIF